MGKVKKAPVSNKDEGQKKISSFFQKFTEKQPATTRLFSEVGTNVCANNHFTATKVSPPTISKAKESKSPPSVVTIINDDAEFDEFAPASKKIRSPTFQSKICQQKPEKAVAKVSPASVRRQHSRADENDDHSEKPKQPEPAFVPETQLFFTPENKQKRLEKKDHEVGKTTSDLFQSPGSGTCNGSDFGIIPDTPESSEIPVRTKRPLGRSFLLSATSLASNPIEKAKENRAAKLALKKKAASARKPSISVSVEFNNQKNVPNESFSKPSVLLSTSSINMWKSPCDAERGGMSLTSENVSEDKTPTKVYTNSENVSVKRMSKPGISPASKRSDEKSPMDVTDGETTVRVLNFDAKTSPSGDGLSEADGGNEKLAAKSAESIDPRKTESDFAEPFGGLIKFEKLKEEKIRQKKERLEKKKLELLKEKMRREKEIKKKNHEKLLNYQLSGNVCSNKRQSCDNPNGIFRETDDALEDLLQELKSPGLLKSDVKTKPSFKHMLSKEAKSLSDNCDMEATCDDLTVLKPKLPVTCQPVNLESNDSLGFMVAEWTDEDESFFKKLGMSTEAVDGGKTATVPNKKVEEIRNTSSETNTVKVHFQERVKPTLKTDLKTAGRLHDSGGIYIDKEVDIKEFQTQNSANSNHCTDSTENDIALFPTPRDQVTCETIRTGTAEEMEIDEFGTQLDSQLLCDSFEHLTPFEESRSSSEIFQTKAPCVEFDRHIVTAVDHDSANHETTLTLSSQPSEIVRKCVLHGFWLDTHLQAGDVVNVLAKFQNNVCHITDTEGLLIVNPDILLSGTTVVSSVFCMRKSILKEKFKGCDSGNIQMLYGSIIHSVFQQVLRKKLLTEEAILQEADRIVRQTSNLLEMYGNKVTEDRVVEELKSYLPQMIGWTKQHTNIGQDIFGNQRKTRPDILVTKVSDIEENIWSPRFGIKGKIDLTVEAQLKDEKSRKIVPLELKTGKPSYSVEHKGQVTLYSMMCSDRREDPRQGLLLYLKEPSMKVIPADHANQKGLIQLRNEMAYYISRQVLKTVDQEKQTTFNLGRLPEPITNLRACQKCPQLINCAIYQREVESRQSKGDVMSGLVDDTLQHLTSGHMTYFTHWCLMLDLESQKDQAKRTVADIWFRSSQDRESVGECLSGVVLLTSGSDDSTDSDSVIATFQRHKNSFMTTPLHSVGINVQDSVVISCEKPSWIAVCTGFVQEISTSDIQILIDREGADRLSQLKTMVLRIDKCDNFSTAGMFYTNLSRLMADDPHCQKLRSLIIDRARPEFLNTLSKGNIEKVKTIFKFLNKPQKTAVLKVLMGKDYVLIKGYPGTGKTSTIVALVKVLGMLGYSVLLTSYTHSAVDNILLKLKKDCMKFLRLGRISKIHPDIQEFSVDKMTQGIKTTAQLEEFLHSQNIVATSCLGTNHPLFTRKQYDVCIVDEASQVVQPACLGPLFCCKKFVLVGDPKQLPPVVQSKEARDLGMDESLFLRLENAGATFDLNLQYRMNSNIMYLSNKLVYDGCLKCGSDSVAERVLQIPNRNSITKMLADHSWLSAVVDCELNKSVIFLDTEKVPAPEEKSQAGAFQNPAEAQIVLKIVQTLVLGGVDPDEIGIIAPYRSQVFLIRSRLSEGEGHLRSKVEVNTVDQYQGRDKSVIVISFVRSSDDQENLTGELLKDIRRLNVALTRAKVKLVLIGNISTLEHYAPLKKLIQILRDRDQILHLGQEEVT